MNTRPENATTSAWLRDFVVWSVAPKLNSASVNILCLGREN